MKKFLGIGAAIALVLTLTACGELDAIDIQQTGTNGGEAVLIAYVDGCHIWRIDDGRYVYFAKCDGGLTTSLQHDYNCGKGCTATQKTIGKTEE